MRTRRTSTWRDSSVEVVHYRRDTILKEADFIFEKLKDYEKMQEHFLIPKIDGRWKVALVKFRLPHLRDIFENMSPFVDYVIYASDIDPLKEEYPQLFKDELDSFARYLELIGAFPIIFEKSASRELFKRAKGNIDVIKDTLQLLLEDNAEKDIIVRKDIEAVILPDNTVYARDVALALLLNGNTLIPRKGSYLSKYTYTSWVELYNKLINNLDERITYYALRKYFYALYERKMGWLTEPGYECKDLEVIKNVDVYTLTFIRILFEQSTPKQLYAVLKTIEERVHGASKLHDKINPYRR